MNISGDWLSAKPAQTLLAALQCGGYQALFVGGCVRNAVLGMPVADVDIATDALPKAVMELAAQMGFQAIPTGLEHGTITVIVGAVPYEVTTFRRDIDTDGRHATVQFTQSIHDDAARRDFTMNALYARADGAVIDPLGGMADLRARRVRFVGDAAARIAEDYLRILRFFRFHAVYGDLDPGFDAEDLAAIAGGLSGLETLSRECIGAEMRKLLSARDPATALACMAMTGVLAQVLPGSDPKYIAPIAAIEAGLPPSWICRLAALGGLDAQNALRLSLREAASLRAITDEIGTQKTAAALAWLHGAQIAQDVLICRAAMFEVALSANWQTEIARGRQATLPVSAADFMPQLSGPALGAALKQARLRWLASDLSLTRAQLLA